MTEKTEAAPTITIEANEPPPVKSPRGMLTKEEKLTCEVRELINLEPRRGVVDISFVCHPREPFQALTTAQAHELINRLINAVEISEGMSGPTSLGKKVR